MTAPELKRYECSETGGGEMIEYPHGEYVRFADVEAHTKASIAAAMMEAVKPLEWFNIGSLGDLRAQSIVGRYEIIAQPNGSYSLIIGARIFWNETLSAAKAAAQADYADRILSALSIPTDPMAALDAVKARARDDVLESPEVNALIDAVAYMVNHAEWREQNDGVFWKATDLARTSLAAIRAMKGRDQ